jgi:hypothetical protein
LAYSSALKIEEAFYYESSADFSGLQGKTSQKTPVIMEITVQAPVRIFIICTLILILIVIKSRRMRDVHVACMGDEKRVKSIVGKIEGKGLFGRSRRR